MAELDQGIKRLVQLRPNDWLIFLFGPLATYLGTAPTDVATEPQLILDTLLHILCQVPTLERRELVRPGNGVNKP